MISNTIKLILIQKNISNSELARRLSIKRQSINSQLKYWENGGTPTIKTINAWSKAIDINPNILLKEITLLK